MVQNIINSFWNGWRKNFFPSLLIRQKWHTERRNVAVGDVVLLSDKNEMRGAWKLARVSEAFQSSDCKVRRVTLQYKNIPDNEPTNQYVAHKFVTIKRPVQKLIVICPVEEQNC